MSIFNAITTVLCFLPLVISVISFTDNELVYTQGGVIFIMSMFCIFLIPSAISNAQLLSVPFALLKQICHSEYFGFYVGLLNCAIIVAQIISYLLSLLFEDLHEEIDTVNHQPNIDYHYSESFDDPYDQFGNCIISFASLCIVFYFVTSILSVFIRRVYKYQKQSEYSNDFGDSED